MNQESDDLPLNTPPDERVLDRQPRRPLSPQDERLARLRELRRQRGDVGSGPIPTGEFRRRGLPAPPPEQPSFQELVKHWWQHGPLGGLPDGYKKPTNPKDATGRGEPPLPTMPTPYEERAKELLAQGRKSLSLASARAKDMMNQAREKLNQKAPSQPHLPTQKPVSAPHPTQPPPAPPISAPQPSQPLNVGEIVPGMIIVGFEMTIPRDQAIQEILSVGGKPLRHKESQNLFQVAVPLGHELALMQQLLLQPGVVSADLHRERPPRGGQ